MYGTISVLRPGPVLHYNFLLGRGLEGILTLIYDGCFVRQVPRRDAIDLVGLEGCVLKDTGYHMIIEEKELFDTKPQLSLARSFD